MAAQRTANVVWEGDLPHGRGTIVGTTSGAIGNLPMTWAARTERPDGKTSPEELLAAAHAACMAMAFSYMLSNQGHTPERLEVSAQVTFAPQAGGGFKVSDSHLTIRGKVPGMDAAAFAEAVRNASCPISAAIQGNVDIQVDGSLIE